MKTLKLLPIIVVLLCQNIYAQQTSRDKLIEILDKYEISDKNEEKDSLWLLFTEEFEKKIQSSEYDLEAIKNKFDTLNFRLIQSYSETNTFKSYSISRNYFDTWNYVTKTSTDNTHEVILKNDDKDESMEYNIEIHDLNPNEFLLLSRSDDMSFSYYSAYVMKYEDHYVIRTDAFKDKQDVLTVHSWTNLDESYSVANPATGLYEIQGGTKSYEPIKMHFNYKTKTLSYPFYRLKDGKKIIRKAKYRNHQFNLESYDQREMF